VVPVLAVASFFVHGRLVAASQFELTARTAQRARANVLRVQLDEETGLRGFTSTGDRDFLEPYTSALARSSDAFANLARAVRGVGVFDAAPLVERERSDNAAWIASVARPLLVTPLHSVHAIAIQRAGRRIVNDFRSVDARLQAMLDGAAAAAYDRADREISLILALNLVVLSVLVVAALGFGFLQARAARAAFEARVLYENEKRIADALQEAFLQKTLPLTPGVGLHATYVPASREAQVGGDWYDAFALPDNRILFSIGDVAGHGLDAAVVMNRARQAIVSAALHENDPAVVLARANRSLLVQDSRMVTAICGYLDPASRTIVYATAGHPAPVMARPDGTAEFMEQSGLPLGIVPEARYTTFHAVAEPGALMVLYTDGVLEHKRDVIAGQARLLEAARRAVGCSDPALTIEQCVFEGSRPTDDVAILAISFAEIGVEGDGASLSALQLNRWRAQAEPLDALRANGATHEAPVENVDVDRLAVTDIALIGPSDRESARIGRRAG
jgi:serine phosphatase RsbU (regulator of sigma subunit)/CHASE3 domain sensor protein